MPKARKKRCTADYSKPLWKDEAMTESVDEQKKPQAAAGGIIVGDGVLQARAGGLNFSIGSKTGNANFANKQYDAAVANYACTSLTIELVATRKAIPLKSLEVAVSYSHGPDRGGTFETLITLRGELSSEQRALLVQMAGVCPVAKRLTRSAIIRARENVENLTPSQAIDSYENVFLYFRQPIVRLVEIDRQDRCEDQRDAA